jgi:hypothetical protein
MTIGGTVGGGVLLDSDHHKDEKCWGHEWIPKEVEDNSPKEGVGDSRPDWLQN